jgi:hypothetical protein
MKMRFLSEEWLEERFAKVAVLEPSPGVTLRIQHVVVDAPGGATVRYYDEVKDGSLLSSGLGDIAAPDVTLTNTWTDELRVLRGEIDPLMIAMTGRLTVDGDQGGMLAMLPILLSDEVAGIAVELAALITED